VDASDYLALIDSGLALLDAHEQELATCARRRPPPPAVGEQLVVLRFGYLAARELAADPANESRLLFLLRVQGLALIDYACAVERYLQGLRALDN
jgi:hypothetical protein